MHHDACRLVASYLALSGSKHTCPVAGWLKHVAWAWLKPVPTHVPKRVSGTVPTPAKPTLLRPGRSNGSFLTTNQYTNSLFFIRTHTNHALHAGPVFCTRHPMFEGTAVPPANAPAEVHRTRAPRTAGGTAFHEGPGIWKGVNKKGI